MTKLEKTILILEKSSDLNNLISMWKDQKKQKPPITINTKAPKVSVKHNLNQHTIITQNKITGTTTKKDNQ